MLKNVKRYLTKLKIFGILIARKLVKINFIKYIA